VDEPLLMSRQCSDKLFPAGNDRLSLTDSGDIATWAQEAELSMMTNERTIQRLSRQYNQTNTNLTRAEAAALIVKFIG